MGGKNSPPPPPDYSGIIAANEKTAEAAMKLSRDQFNWAKQVYNENKQLSKDTGVSFLKQMEFGRKAAEEDRARYKAKYQPLEDAQIQEARTYDTQARRDREVGAAVANVAQQFQSARDAHAKQLESFGINPSATRYSGLDANFRAQEAATKAAAGTGAIRAVEDKASALRGEAVNVGRGYPAQYSAASALSRQAGEAAVGGANQSFATGAGAMGTGVDWMNQGVNAYGNVGNIMGDQYRNQLGYYNAQQDAGGGWGGALGLGLGILGKRFGFQEGGAVPTEMSPSEGAKPDDVPVAVSVGEFVIPKEAVQWFGEKYFYKQIEKAQQERAETQAVPA